MPFFYQNQSVSACSAVGKYRYFKFISKLLVQQCWQEYSITFPAIKIFNHAEPESAASHTPGIKFRKLGGTALQTGVS
ncbi:hypothetical protein EPIR_2855 [Erwinia piriflorinigrans CFBP 5888]|uniref:Uncharacterized protein n=1 Tax=Erwinia piriflorinigrans CFBP 5888 TaxID=1161919 RepID=V5ZA31_9GAMM|nr:hypothetical protein EPIR_2855 [Erwinia piriflorinigrans CFBP 5888]